ncbi:MAG: Ldh family oxidoreductase [Dinoroseobacter sp.]|nr:Ldh family oxidoreductase [Dinoroseobacter sp.]
MTGPKGDDGRVTEAEAQELGSRAFVRLGVAPEAARDAAVALTTAEMMGISTHGLIRVADYATRLQAGGMMASATPNIDRPAPALVRVDGRDGLGPATAVYALRSGMAAARDAGMAGVFVRRGTHLGALAPYLLQATEAGFAAIMTSNTAPMIAPPGGRTAMAGNMPLGIAMPGFGQAPLLLDMALTVVSRSRIRTAAKAGTDIPEGWAYGPDGHPTTDPQAALDGLIAALGGQKGAALALSLDVFAGVLAGARFLDDIPDTHKTPEAAPGLAYTMFLVDAAKLAPPEELRARVNHAHAKLARAPVVDPAQPARLPGARAVERLQKARAEGFSVKPETLARLRELAGA